MAKTRIPYYKTLYNQHNKEIKRLIEIENNKNWENKCNKLELTENIDDSWKHLKQIMGTKHSAPKYPTLEVTINNVTTKMTTTEQKVETLTKTLEQTVTHDQDKKQFSKARKLDIIHNLYNICWIKGYFPSNWKTPKTILLNKPDKSKKDPNDYKPIALINCLAKLLEKIIKEKLTQYAETNNLINKEQAGFRQKKSTHEKLFQLTQIATQTKNRKQACGSWMWKSLRQSMAQRPAPHHGSTKHSTHIPKVHQQLPFQQAHILPNRKHQIQTHQNQPWRTTRIVTQRQHFSSSMQQIF